MKKKPSAWIVIPAYHEEKRIRGFIAELTTALLPSCESTSFHILIVNDGSRDGTEGAVRSLVGTLPTGFTIECVSLLRNFGHQAALTCGLTRAAAGDADFAVTLDGDGEHPPAVIPQLIAHWRQGAPIVHTLRREHEGLGWFKRMSSRAFYLLMNAGAVNISAGMADFKLWDGDLLRQIAPHLPLCGSTRLFAAWLAPDAPRVEFDQIVIAGRVSRFTLRKMISLAFRGFFSYSDIPIRIGTLFGLISIALSLLYLLFVLYSFSQGKTVPGWTSLTLLITLFGGIQVFCIGILGEYLIQRNFRSLLPNFVIRSHRNDHLDVK
jgi:dolichol-phosphate mannosyltransferase